MQTHDKSQLWLSIKQFSFRPHTQIFIPIPARFQKLIDLASIRRHSGNDMLHSPLGFTFRISRGMTGYFFTYLSSIFFFPPLAQGGI